MNEEILKHLPPGFKELVEELDELILKDFREEKESGD